MTLLDAITLAIIVVVVVVNVFFLLWLAALPGQIAHSRGHHQTTAITACGWLSLLTCFATWPLAMIWAYTRPLAIETVDQAVPAPTARSGKPTP